ncbi:hypothetical protein BaRGS_00024947 [Batillaria attramentaria]|uniref:Uncharacterized protein n=1 Tax=Batillaria attramentaria TaxID=370345 RepID=A0ABD0K9Q3_9CAEN
MTDNSSYSNCRIVHRFEDAQTMMKMICYCLSVAGPVITCDAPAVPEGEPAFITCHFDRDVTESKKAYAIHRYDNNGKFEDTPATTEPMQPGTGSKSKKEEEETSMMAIVIPVILAVAVLAAVAVTVFVLRRRGHKFPYCKRISTDKAGDGANENSKENDEAQESLINKSLDARTANQRNQQHGKSAARCTEINKPDGEISSQDAKDNQTDTKTSEAQASNPEHRQKKVPPRPSAQPNKTKQLLSACRNNDVEKVKRLIEVDRVSVNSNDGETPLHVAIQGGHEELMKFLLEQRADVEARDERGFTPFHVACSFDKHDAMHLLLDKGAKVNTKAKDDVTPLHTASRYGFKYVLDELLRAGAEVDAKDVNGMTPLHWACKFGKLESIQMLLKWEADINAKAKDRTTPLHVACQYGQEKVMEILLQRPNCNIEAKDKKGMTALRWACEKKMGSLAKILIAHGANVNTRREDDTTPLHAICQNGEEPMMQTLQSGKPESKLDVADTTGKTALHVAERLLRHSAKVNARDQNDWTPLHYACREGRDDIVTLLFDHKADLKAITRDGLKPKDLAKRRHQTQTVELLNKLTKERRGITASRETLEKLAV